VISKVLKEDHMLENHHLTVAPYYECLGPIPPGMGNVPCWTPPTVTVNFDPRIVQFVVLNDEMQSHLEASINDLSPGCTITWPDSTTSDAGMVEISVAGANNSMSSATISKTCRDRLTELLGMIQAESVNILQEIWPEFVEQLQKEIPKADKNVYVEIDADKYCVHVVGERQKCGELLAKLGTLQSGLVEKLQCSKTRISEHIPDIPQHRLSLLKTCGFFQTESTDDLIASVVDGIIVLEGQPDKVVNWKVKIYQMLASAHGETVRVDEYVLEVLKQEPFRRHLDQLLQNITGVIWYSSGKEIKVLGENQDKVS